MNRGGFQLLDVRVARKEVVTIVVVVYSMAGKEENAEVPRARSTMNLQRMR
jgi:hypothetical protein